MKIATPVSHLFRDPAVAKKIVKHSDCVEARPYSLDLNLANQELFHCDHIQPIHTMSEDDFEYIRTEVEKLTDLKLISFHCAVSCDRPILKDGMFFKGGHDYSIEEMKKNMSRNISKIKKIVGPNVKVAIENNNYYPTDAYNHITNAKFISDIIYENDIYFLFDNGHALVTCYNKKIDYEEYKNNLPMDKLIQIQFCKPSYNGHLAKDAHELPTEEILEEVVALAKKYKCEFLTLEYYKDVEKLVDTLEKLKGKVR